MTWVGVKLEGYDRLLPKLVPGSLYGRQWKAALDDVRKLAEQKTEEHAPVGSGPGAHGSIPAGVSSTMDPRPMPFWAKVSLAPLTKDGFRYAGALHGAKQFKRLHGKGVGKPIQYHYRTGRYMGKLTKGWFTKAKGAARRLLQVKVKQIASHIEATWRA